jgi:transcriptional regulator with XRE-family HTH domain
VITETQIINSNIKNIRKRLGKTQAQVAAAINMDRSYYSRKESKKENGIKFNQSDVKKIIDYFDECDKKFDIKVKKLIVFEDRIIPPLNPSEFELPPPDPPSNGHQLFSKYPDIGHYIKIINEAAKVNDIELVFMSMNKTIKLLKEKYKINNNTENIV